jgi:hypothetical protein
LPGPVNRLGPVTDSEQQERWLRARARRSLNPADPEFGESGLHGKRDGSGVGVLVLPADDLAQPVDFTDELLAMIPERFTGLTANGVGPLHAVTSTSGALIRFSPGTNDEGWGGFIAVERCGGVQCGVGATSRYPMPIGVSGATGPPVLRLFALVHVVRVAVQLQAGVIEWAKRQLPEVLIGAPFEVIVAVPDAIGVVLGGLNEGWEQPEHSLLPPARAEEANVLVRAQVVEWPNGADETRDLVLRVLDRACEAFGDRDRRYISRAPATSGTMHQGYA